MANKKDFATSTVITAPSPANSGTSLVIQSGHGARFPAAPFYVTVHPPSELPTLDNAEKILVTAKSTDTFTLDRAEGDTTAQSIETGWRISNALFLGDIPGTFDDLTDGSTNKAFTNTLKTKLDGIATGATANTGDVTLAGTQTLTNKTISGSSNTISDIVATTSLTATGTKSSSTYLRGDNTWATPTNTTYSEITTAEIDAGTASTSRTITGRRVDYIQDKTLERAYPVGSIYISTVSTNPNTLFGFGTWVAYGEGRVIVGKAASGTFATAGSTGGAETHTLTTAEVPAHSHKALRDFYAYANTGWGGTEGSGANRWTGLNAANTLTDTVGGDGAHNNLQPYIVAYMWHRTA